GLSEQETYFDICKSQSGAIESITAIPNKSSSSIQLDLILKDSRNINISLYDLSGKLLKKFDNYNLDAGIQSLNLNIDNIHNGIFLLSVQSDKSELVVKKIFLL
ncbi:MAG: T9SS type A sorting domain-containing protein, partial [Bacteroidota bacterium]